MHCTKTITSDLIWVGANDRRLSMFEGIYSIPRGVSYNSYLLLDEKTVLFDAVDRAVERVFFENLTHALGGRQLDYVVVQHMEPDHTAPLCDLILRYPEVTVVCNKKSEAMIKRFFDCDFTKKIVDEGDTLNTGRHSLRFIMAPMVHWPEVMMTYDETDKILFSADAFGSFGALSGAIFADEVDFERDYLGEARRYYCNIVGKYGPQVSSALGKALAREIRMICPLHGYVWRKNLEWYIEKHRRWSSYTPEESGVMIAYASIYGNTANAAEIIACRLADRGIRTEVFDVSVTPASEIVAAAFRYSHLIFASATYNGGIFPTMEAVLLDIAAHNLQNRTVALLQNGSWAPSSGKQMRGIIDGLKNMTVVGETVTVKSSLKGAEEEAINGLVAAVAQTLPAADAPEALDLTALFKLSYGLFILSAREGGRDNGCIINTVEQLTDTPNRITVSVRKQNCSHDMIMRTGILNVSVLTEEVPFEVFKHFGFQSGRDVDKFAGYEGVERSPNGLLYTTKYTNALISGRVVGTHDYGTHTLFVAEVTCAKLLSSARSVTYDYYFANIKPKPAQKPRVSEKKRWVCRICGYVYDEAVEGVPFENLPADWTCPLCKHPKSDFDLEGGAEPDTVKDSAEKKPAPPQKTPIAPTQKKADEQERAKDEAKQPSGANKIWACRICGYIYDEAAEGVPFEELPADWTCPLCKHPKSDFELIK